MCWGFLSWIVLAATAHSQTIELNSEFDDRYAEHLRTQNNSVRLEPRTFAVRAFRTKKKQRRPRVFSYERYVLEQIFAYFNAYAREFHISTDRNFARMGDFHFQAVRNYRKVLPSQFALYLDIWETVVFDNQLGVKSKGGAAGLRYTYRPNRKSGVSLSVAPIAIEDLTYYDGSSYLSFGSDRFYRHSSALELRHLLRGSTEASARMVFEPALLDFGEFRVYVETYARFTAYKNQHRHRHGVRLEEIKVIPKVVYIDHPQTGTPLDRNFSFFTKLEFRFQAQ